MEWMRKRTHMTPNPHGAVKRMARQGTTKADIQTLDGFLKKHRVVESGEPFAGLTGIFEGPVEVDHDDVYR